MKIVYATNPLIREKSKKIEKFDEELVNLSKEMFEQMYKSGGIGLSAIQVGIPKRMLVIDISKPTNEKNEIKKEQLNVHEKEYDTYGKFCMINPEIISKSDEKTVEEEGCLSCPGFNGPVERPLSIEAEYFDEYGKKHKIKATDLLSRCIQHEMDHLNGVLFIDYLSKLKKDMATKKIKKYLKEHDKKI